jgi:hypothetical protein
MANTLIDTVSNQLDKGRPDDGRETIDNRARGCGHLQPNACYVRCDLAALSAPDGEIPPFVELKDPVEYREHTGRGAIIPGYKGFPGTSFLKHYIADGRVTAPPGDVDDHIDRLGRFGFDGDHYADITSTRAIDLLMSVGKSNYDTPEEYIDECRDRGLNLKIPVSGSQDPPIIEPLRTRVFVIHPDGCGEGRPGIIGYAYVTRNVFTTGTKATEDDPDVPGWAEDFAATRDDFDLVDRGEPIGEDEMAGENQTTIDDVLVDDDVAKVPDDTDYDRVAEDVDPPEPADDRDVATVTVPGDDRDVTGLEVEFGRGDIPVSDRRASFDDATDDGPLTYNALKVIAGNRDDVDVGQAPDQDELITALVDDAYAMVPAYTNRSDDENA